MNPHIVKILWFRFASEVWLLVVAVNQSFYLIVYIQDPEHAMGMLA